MRGELRPPLLITTSQVHFRKVYPLPFIRDIFRHPLKIEKNIDSRLNIHLIFTPGKRGANFLSSRNEQRAKLKRLVSSTILEDLGAKMSVDLYAIRKRAVMILAQNGKRETIYFLQLAVEHALSQDSQTMVDSAVKYAYKEWEGHSELPECVVLVGSNGLPRSGSPIFKWPFFKRAYCFDHELPAPFGYLGEREVWGYLFRTVREQARINIVETARRIDEGSTKVYKDFWHGEVFESGEEFLKFQGQFIQSKSGCRKPGESGNNFVSPRISKIHGLIRCIEEKGQRASPADLHFLGTLREKAMQLGYPC